ncbi:MAG: hypothetical protein ACO3F7_02695 [Luteolibacter sp.]
MSNHGDQGPDQYSFDEIMERLKKSHGADLGPDDGELVTRADGTQAIRIRKRKRRSHQPHHEERLKKRRMHVIQISAALILVLVFALFSGTVLIYANSGFFRESLNAKIQSATGAYVKLEQFRMNPKSAKAELLELKWPESESIKKILARGLDAKVAARSYLGGPMKGDEVVAQQAVVWIGKPDPQASSKSIAKDPSVESIHFSRLAANQGQVIYGDPKSPIFQLQNTELSFMPRSVGETTSTDIESDSNSGDKKSLQDLLAEQNDMGARSKHFPGTGRSVPRLLVNHGDLAFKGWPKLPLDRGQVEFTDGMVEVLGLRVNDPNGSRGMMQFSGKYDSRAVNQTPKLSVVATQFPLEELSGTELGKILSGTIESDPLAPSELLLGVGEDQSASMLLSFRCAPNASLAMHGLPFLKLLANILNDDWYQHPVFTSDVIGTLRRDGAAVAITDLNLLSRDRMALRGRIRYGRERAYDGVLEIGIAPTVIKASGSRRIDQMFGPPKGNFRWMTLKVSGTAALPADDFEAQFDAVGRTETGGNPSGKVPTFEELTRPE